MQPHFLSPKNFAIVRLGGDLQFYFGVGPHWLTFFLYHTTIIHKMVFQRGSSYSKINSSDGQVYISI